MGAWWSILYAEIVLSRKTGSQESMAGPSSITHQILAAGASVDPREAVPAAPPPGRRGRAGHNRSLNLIPPAFQLQRFLSRTQ